MKMTRLQTGLSAAIAACAVSFAANAGTWHYDFNEGSNGAPYKTVVDIYNGVYDTSIRYGNSGAAVKSTISSGSEGSIGIRNWAFPVKQVKGGEMWMRFRTYYPAGFSFKTGSGYLKFIRFDDSARGFFDLLISNNFGDNPTGWVQQHEVLVDTVQPQVWFGNSSSAIHREQWETWEIYVKWDDTTNGRWRFWRNGELLNDKASRTLLTASSQKTRMLLTDYWNDGAPKTQSMWLDDLTITTDTPSGRDANGNPYIGMADAVNTPPTTLKKPATPTGVVAQ
jgi:hypothetical protein